MKTVLIIFAAATLVQNIMAATSHGHTKLDPKNPNNCLDEETGKSFPIGEFYYPRPDECYVTICGRDSSYEIQTCPIGFVDDKKCNVRYPRRLPYPECCEDCVFL